MLSLLLFIIYVNDLNPSLKLEKSILFADDTAMYAYRPLLVPLNNIVNDELSLRSNKFSLNIHNTKFMVISKRKSSNEIELSIGGHKLGRVASIKILGIIVDEKKVMLIRPYRLLQMKIS